VITNLENIFYSVRAVTHAIVYVEGGGMKQVWFSDLQKNAHIMCILWPLYTFLVPSLTLGKATGKAYLYSTFHTQWQFKVLYMEEIKIIKRNQNN